MAETILRQNIIVQYEADNADLKRKTKESQETVKGFGVNLKKALAVGAAGLTFAAAVNEISKAKEVAADFEKELSSLSSLTGATGQDLQAYRQSALDLGESTILSASQVVEGFKLIGSAKPELLQDRDALIATTEAAITLAEAAELELGPAAQSLAGTLNQFNLAADESGRVINALAAGSKAGAANIPEITQAMDKFGTTANAANFSVEESIGLIETLAEKNIKGAEAGTSLRNILIKLSTVKALPKEALDQLEKFGVDLDLVSDASRPAEERLLELGKIAGDSTALVKVFGAENVTAGGIILNNVDKFKQYTDAVTGTSTALEQARINTDNYQGDVSRLNSAIEGLQIKVGELIIKAVRPAIRFLTAFFLALSEGPKFIRENRVALGSLVAGLVLLNGQLILSAANSLRLAAAERGRLILTRSLTIAQNLLNLAMTNNPIGALIKTVSILLIAFGALYNRSETLRNIFAGLSATAKELGSIVVETFGGFIDGFKQLIDGDIAGGLKKIGTAIIKANPISLATNAGKRLSSAYADGFADNAAKEKAERAGKDLYDAFSNPLSAEVIKQKPIGVLLEVTPQVNEIEEPKDPPVVGPSKGSIKELEERLKGLVERYQNINTQTDKGKILARELTGEIQKLTIQVQQLKQEYEDSLNRSVTILPEIQDGRISDIREAIKKLDEQIQVAIQEGNDNLVDELIIRRTAIENQLIQLAGAWRDPSLVTDQIDSFNQKIVDAIQRGATDQARALIAQRNSLEAQVQALGVLAGDQKAVEEFAGLTEKVLVQREERLSSFFENQKTQTDKLIQEGIKKREEEREEEKKTLEERKQETKDSLQNLGSEVIQFTETIYQARREAYDNAIQTQEDRVDKFAKLAETGSERQLVIEQDRLDRLNQAREEAAQKERTLAQAQVAAAQAVTTAKTAQAISTAFAEGGPLGIITGLAMSAALLLSLTSAISSVGGLLSNIPAFATGTEYLDGPGSGTSDSILIRASRGERITDAATNSQLGGIPNARLPEAVDAWRNSPAIIGAIMGQTVDQRQHFSTLIEETRSVRREIRTQTSEIALARLESRQIRRRGIDNKTITG